MQIQLAHTLIIRKHNYVAMEIFEQGLCVANDEEIQRQSYQDMIFPYWT